MRRHQRQVKYDIPVYCCGHMHHVLVLDNGRIILPDHPEGLRTLDRLSQMTGGMSMCDCHRVVRAVRFYWYPETLDKVDVYHLGHRVRPDSPTDHDRFLMEVWDKRRTRQAKGSRIFRKHGHAAPVFGDMRRSYML